MTKPKLMILYSKGRRIASVPLDKREKINNEFHVSLIQRDVTGHEHYNIVAPKNRRLRP